MKITLEDFSGGITDFKENAPPNQYEYGDNFVIDKDKGLSVRYGSDTFSTAHVSSPSGTIRIGAAFPFKDLLHIQSASRLWWYSAANGYTELNTTVGTVTNAALQNCTASTNISFAEWNGVKIVTDSAYSKPIKLYRDSGGTIQISTAGLPPLSSTPVVSLVGGTVSRAYGYAFTHERTFNIDTYTNTDISAVVYVDIEGNAEAIDSLTPATIAISSTLSNSAGTHYDLANTQVGVYRTENGGSTYYKVATATIGQSSVVDTITDSVAILQDRLYTTGGVVENDEPPLAKYVVTANDICWYLNVKETVGTITSTLPFRIRQSIQGDVDSCPEDFYIDVEGDLTGGGFVGKYLIAFTKDRSYRIEGRLDEFGQGGIFQDVISDTKGCINNRSVISTSVGVYFCGEDAIYFTDGFKIKTLAEKPNQGFALLDTYKSLTETQWQRDRIQAAYDNKTGRVFFQFASVDGQECNTILVYDETYDSFTKWNGNTGWTSECIAYFNNNLIRCDRRFVLKHDSSMYYDKILSGTFATAWKQDHIPFKFRHINFDFGTKDVRKWVTKVTVQSNADTDVNFLLRAFNDSNSAKELQEIAFKNQLEWGDPNWLWNDPEAIWDWITVMSKTRRFVAGSLRCRYKQLEILPDKKIIRSDDYSTATVVGTTTKTATIDNLIYLWDNDVVNWHIRFEADGYEEEHEITDRNSDSVITFSDTDNSAPTGSVKWEIVGYPKDQRPIITRLVYTFENMDDHGGYFIKEKEPEGNE